MQNVVPGPGAPASPGNPLELQSQVPIPDPLNLLIWVEPSTLFYNKPCAGDSEANSSLSTCLGQRDGPRLAGSVFGTRQTSTVKLQEASSELAAAGTSGRLNMGSKSSFTTACVTLDTSPHSLSVVFLLCKEGNGPA